MTKKVLNLLKDLEIEAKSYFDQWNKKINKAHDWNHVMRVVKNCEKILEHQAKVNKAEIFVAAYLHDIGRFKDEDGEHAEWSYLESKKLLAQYEKDFKDDIDFTKVLSIIRYHSLKVENVPDKNIANSMEFLILTDADKIDSFGPVGILRAPLDPRFKTIDDQIKHIKEKAPVGEYPLYTDGGKAIGLKQKEYLDKFVNDFKEQTFQDISEEKKK